MEKLIVGLTPASELTIEERNILSVAYKNAIGSLRFSSQDLKMVQGKVASQYALRMKLLGMEILELQSTRRVRLNASYLIDHRYVVQILDGLKELISVWVSGFELNFPLLSRFWTVL
ncbi:LOW QUALITY PROTEIN: hypothetical protein M8C21_033949 [Ambrosia artemisiifolia]|uniref:Uncharacterized protein n=1 Tax=Ambrosia artemisiifolia TaxID=4212 RepID=A0AAD5CS58_AMBAR|nr:LOW QUALITY PROTEIN: hypothetical protein M8C21_033949 [Ambrosia artemisiifolia]